MGLNWEEVTQEKFRQRMFINKRPRAYGLSYYDSEIDETSTRYDSDETNSSVTESSCLADWFIEDRSSNSYAGVNSSSGPPLRQELVRGSVTYRGPSLVQRRLRMLVHMDLLHAVDLRRRRGQL